MGYHTKSRWGFAALLLLTSACATTRRVDNLPPSVTMNYSRVARGEVRSPGVIIQALDGSFEMRAGEMWSPPFDQGADCVLQPSADPGPGLRSGAKQVSVQVPGREQPLYGLLSLCGAPPGATGPATRVYQIEVPQAYVDATEGGRVSVVFEPHQAAYDYGTPMAWILWLSQYPLDQMGTAELVTARSAAQAQANAVHFRQVAAQQAPASGASDDDWLMLIPLVAGVVGIAILIPLLLE